MKKGLPIILLVLLFSVCQGSNQGFPEGKHNESAKQENNCYQSGSAMPMGRLSYMYYLDK